MWGKKTRNFRADIPISLYTAIYRIKTLKCKRKILNNGRQCDIILAV